MINFFDWDPGDPEQSAHSSSMPDRDPCAHNLTPCPVSSGQLTPNSPERHLDDAEHRARGARDG